MKTDALFYLEILQSVDARFFVKSQGSWREKISLKKEINPTNGSRDSHHVLFLYSISNTHKENGDRSYLGLKLDLFASILIGKLWWLSCAKVLMCS